MKWIFTLEIHAHNIFLPFFFEMCKIGQQTSLLNHYFLYYISLHYICTLFYVLTNTCVQHCLVIFSFSKVNLQLCSSMFLKKRKFAELTKNWIFFLKMEVKYILIVIHGLYNNNNKMHIFCRSKNVVGISLVG